MLCGLVKLARRFDGSPFAFAKVLRVAFATVARGQGVAALQ
ncbi:MAG: hypothetical protein RL685_1052 [Pseudomonadota bacterium]|jgi:hypothetical protein